MRKVILTRNNNILLYTAVSQGNGFVLPANKYVELAVLYKDNRHEPLHKRRLSWRIVEGDATLRQPTTLTNGKGLGINRIKVELKNPEEQATIRLAVSPLDEPDSELEFECSFGATTPFPAVTDKNVLMTVFPRNDSTKKTIISTMENSVFSFIYADRYGDIIRGVNLSYSFLDNNNGIGGYTNRYNDYLYISNDIKPKYVGFSRIYTSVNDYENRSDTQIFNDASPTMQVNNFWPPNGSVLKPGFAYPFRALYTGGFGKPFVNEPISWIITNSSNNKTLTLTAWTNQDGIALATTLFDPLAYGMSGDINVSVVRSGADENTNLVFDNLNFKIGGAQIVNVQPSTSTQLVLGEPIPFSVTVQNEDGVALQNVSIQWAATNATGVNVRFDPPVSSTDANGRATSSAICTSMPQGATSSFVVSITPPDGEPYSGKYSIRSNKIIQIAPLNDGPFDVRDPVTVSVILRNLGSTAIANKTLTVIPSSPFNVSNRSPVTGPDGIASFQVTSTAASSATINVYENGAYTQPTAIPLTFGVRTIALTPPIARNMRYDSWLTVTATFADGSGQPVAGTRLTWNITNGVEIENNSTTTAQDGSSTNRIRYQTLNGYPSPAITTQLTVTASDGTSTTQPLTFTASSLTNKLKLITPLDGTSLPIEQPTVVTLQLTNSFGNPLANYPISWEEPTDEAVVLDYDPKTGANGEATALVKGTIGGEAQFDAVVQNALATCNFSFDFVAKALPDYSVLIGNTYAHNPPKGSPVNPYDDSQVLTFTFRYLSNGVPQSNQQVIWYFSPRTPDLRFFDSNNSEINVQETGNIITKTDANGLSVLKIGSLTRFMGTTSVGPYNDPNAGVFEYSIVIATFDSGDIEPSLMPVIYDPNPIAIPDRFSTEDPGFAANIQTPQTNVSGQNVVFWISSGAPGMPHHEQIKTVPIEKAEQGIVVPYSYVYPDPDRKGNNSIAYMVAQRSTTNSFLARAVTPAVTGNAMSNHPDYSNTHRILPSPHLFNYANVVNGNSITNGLIVYIPYSTLWLTHEEIKLKIYLNGDNEKGILYGNTLIYSHTITSSEVVGKSDITILIPQDQLSGYDKGTFEADYYIEDMWSNILEGVTLDTSSWH